MSWDVRSEGRLEAGTKRSRVFFIFAIVVVAAVTVWALINYSGLRDRSEGPKPDVSKKQTVERMIESGELSDHQADYYKEVEQ